MAPPASNEWIRTFGIITTDANELVADIHDRMPIILSRYYYARGLSEEPDLLRALNRSVMAVFLTLRVVRT
jgi:putative SOS response-associated peptidase YedK